VTTEGVWRISKKAKSSILEVSKLEETGTGDILSPAFKEWRNLGLEVHLVAQAKPSGQEPKPP
jgi:hypothetical protein